ncbi:metal-sulfur cluster assembly factor [candidate division WOR-3 bacterium]|nr:metal-sulfur cluster assembly factor [candidate division WOR-3 bacterium]
MAIKKEDVLDALREVVDPEIGFSIVDLGLIYDVSINGGKVKVDMTLTVRGCPLQAMLTEAAKNKVLQIPGVKDAEINLVWDPPWNPSMISEELKKRFGYK